MTSHPAIYASQCFSIKNKLDIPIFFMDFSNFKLCIAKAVLAIRVFSMLSMYFVPLQMMHRLLQLKIESIFKHGNVSS